LSTKPFNRASLVNSDKPPMKTLKHPSGLIASKAGRSPVCRLGQAASEEFQSALGEFFLVRYPDDWPESDRYYFSWAGIMAEQDPFQNLVL
jgi:hypothetical protein